MNICYMTEIGPNLSRTLISLLIILAVGFALYITKNSWCLLGLIFLIDFWKDK